MNEELVTATTFQWILTFLTGSLAGVWLVHDAILLARSRTISKTPLESDVKFGYVVGIVIGAIGLWGCLRYHGVV
jgi:hypothetical protein